MFLCVNVRDYVDLFGILSSAVTQTTDMPDDYRSSVG